MTFWPSGPMFFSASSRIVERDVVRREELLVVVEDHVLAAGEVAVGREDERDVRVTRVEHLVLLLAGHELAELQAVGVLDAEQAVLALLALREAR